MKQGSNIKRQVPIFVPIAITSFLLIGLVTVCILNAEKIQLTLALPLGLAMFFAHLFWTAKDFSIAALSPLVIAAYGLYIALFIAMFAARRWNTLGITCLFLTCVILLNLSGCHQIANGVH
jgi:hypothetical protein